MDILINDEKQKISKILTDLFFHMLSKYDFQLGWEDYDLYINECLYQVQPSTKVQCILSANSKLQFEKKKKGLIIDEINEIYTKRRILDPSDKNYEINHSSYKQVKQEQKQVTQKQNIVYQTDLHAKRIRVPIICKYKENLLLLFEVDQEKGEDRVILQSNNEIKKTFKQDDPNNVIINKEYPASKDLLLYFDHHNVYVYWDNLEFLLVIEWENNKRTVYKQEKQLK